MAVLGSRPVRSAQKGDSVGKSCSPPRPIESAVACSWRRSSVARILEQLLAPSASRPRLDQVCAERCHTAQTDPPPPPHRPPFPFSQPPLRLLALIIYFVVSQPAAGPSDGQHLLGAVLRPPLPLLLILLPVRTLPFFSALNQSYHGVDGFFAAPSYTPASSHLSCLKLISHQL